MTNNFYSPITPPPELIQQWLGEYFGCIVNGEPSASERYLATQAARWGADQELEACCEWLSTATYGDSLGSYTTKHVAVDLRDARCKPPNLKELSLKHLEVMERDGHYLPEIISDLRRALESLPS